MKKKIVRNSFFENFENCPILSIKLSLPIASSLGRLTISTDFESNTVTK